MSTSVLRSIMLLTLGTLVLQIPGVVRADFIEFHTTNVQLLRGWDYKVGDDKRTIITVEHYNRFKYGDFFMFVDVSQYDDGLDNIYGEFAPRISFSRVTGREFSVGPINDVYLAGMLERGKNDLRNFLYGGSVDLDVPGFKVLNISLYVRDNPHLPGQTWQVTTVWKYPIEYGDLKFMAEGFADFAGDEGPRYHANQLVVPRFLLDLGDAVGGASGKWYLGTEIQYWRNKFGIRGTTEFVPQLQIKWVFD